MTSIREYISMHWDDEENAKEDVGNEDVQEYFVGMAQMIIGSISTTNDLSNLIRIAMKALNQDLPFYSIIMEQINNINSG